MAVFIWALLTHLAVSSKAAAKVTVQLWLKTLYVHRKRGRRRAWAESGLPGLEKKYQNVVNELKEVQAARLAKPAVDPEAAVQAYRKQREEERRIEEAAKKSQQQNQIQKEFAAAKLRRRPAAA